MLTATSPRRFAKANRYIAGVDEAGRGPLAGPVVAAAVILPRRFAPIEDLRDSKALTHEQRTGLARKIRARAYVAVGIAEPEEIDRLNILHASMAAMQRAVLSLPCEIERCYIDGNRKPDLPCRATALVGGDTFEPTIMAASIIAKTVRDELMRQADARFPGYDLASNKGYGCPAHYAGLRTLGPSPIHRLSFTPVQMALQGSFDDLIEAASETAED
ncbi:ribonuclease HII [Marinicauda algicola]|uniref:Ribonuclease HII n=1 Tax=Marinicauda algicola TaxID=2029849 RepID=A0A4S2GVX4_9PROT|nr:ribonuclease HII [Marinicauda algicola]TGY87216.1 ribonuclease HII [Marinicauda algicola]